MEATGPVAGGVPLSARTPSPRGADGTRGGLQLFVHRCSWGSLTGAQTPLTPPQPPAIQAGLVADPGPGWAGKRLSPPCPCAPRALPPCPPPRGAHGGPPGHMGAAVLPRPAAGARREPRILVPGPWSLPSPRSRSRSLLPVPAPGPGPWSRSRSRSGPRSRSLVPGPAPGPVPSRPGAARCPPAAVLEAALGAPRPRAVRARSAWAGPIPGWAPRSSQREPGPGGSGQWAPATAAARPMGAPYSNGAHLYQSCLLPSPS